MSVGASPGGSSCALAVTTIGETNERSSGRQIKNPKDGFVFSATTGE